MSFIGRIAASFASFVVVWVLGVIGLDVSPEQQAGIIEWLSQGLTALGTFLFLAFYGVLHKLFDKKLNPLDTAVEPVKEV